MVAHAFNASVRDSGPLVGLKPTWSILLSSRPACNSVQCTWETTLWSHNLVLPGGEWNRWVKDAKVWDQESPKKPSSPLASNCGEISQLRRDEGKTVEVKTGWGGSWSGLYLSKPLAVGKSDSLMGWLWPQILWGPYCGFCDLHSYSRKGQLILALFQWL